MFIINVQGVACGIQRNQIQGKVPCTCEGCGTGNNRQHYFDFGDLQFRLEKGRYEVECDNSLETLNVMELLENTFVFEKFEDGRALRLKENVARERFLEICIINIFWPLQMN